ncbi:MAG: AbrB/MazE/SpoVT family DNA-binding domain-containing protein [Thermoplasmata archaeon]|nr:MAG: AbrB/MazE/SpoVT family DNA-binding domain-containing protein [Thermoplasmata archaeon]
METVSVSTKFQVVIPKAIRNSLALKPGEKMVMYEKDGMIHLVRIQKISKLKGKYKKLTTEGLRDEGERFA